jgi:hypothetical protein
LIDLYDNSISLVFNLFEFLDRDLPVRTIWVLYAFDKESARVFATLSPALKQNKKVILSR